MFKFKLKAVTAACLVALVLAACGGSGSNSSTVTTGGSGHASSSKTAKEVAAAKAATATALAGPTTLAGFTALPSAPPKGKTFVDIQCEEYSSCAHVAAGEAAAAKAIGWNFKKLSFSTTNPASLVAALKQALQYHPVAVSFAALAEPTWQSVLPAYKAAHVVIIPESDGPVAFNSVVIRSVSNSADYYNWGRIVANWFIADSDGKGHALVLTVPAFGALTSARNGMTDTIKNNCSTCSLTYMNASASQVAGADGATSLVVAALRRDPSINYVLTTNNAFLPGFAGALAAAGLSGKVKVAGTLADIVAEQDVLSGSASAFTGFASMVDGWEVVDGAIRHVMGLKVSQEPLLPVRLLTKQNLKTAQDFDNVPADYASQFMKLWKVGQ